jgi:MerR HTH family regulatory protein
MQPEIVEAVRMDDIRELSCAELASLSGLSEAELRELVEYGALATLNVESSQLTFTTHCVTIARTAFRLRHDFDLEPHALALVVKFSARVDELEAQIRALRARLPSGG